MEIVVLSSPERDDLYAEIQVNGQPWFEVEYDREQRRYAVTHVPPADGEAFPRLHLATLVSSLMTARRALIERGLPVEIDPSQDRMGPD